MLVLLFLTSKDSFNLHLWLGSSCLSGSAFFFSLWGILNIYLCSAGRAHVLALFSCCTQARDSFQKALYCLTKEHIWKSPLWGSYFFCWPKLKWSGELLAFLYPRSACVLVAKYWRRWFGRITESSVWKSFSASLFWSLPLSLLKIPNAGSSGCAVLLPCAHADTREEGCRQC